MTAAMATTREAFDALVQRRVLAIAQASPASDPGDPATLSEQQDAIQDAQLLEAQATSFADAVDRSGKELAYEDAVMVEGGAGPVVVSEVEWRATPAYWEAQAAGAAGHIDLIVIGSKLTAYLRDGS